MKHSDNIRIVYLPILIIFLSGIIISACQSESETKPDIKTNGKAKIEFENLSYDFGTLKQGEIVECSFKFKNSGTAPLLLTYVEPDCGCTVPEYKKEPIMPGETSSIKAIFDSNGFRNNIYKTIDVGTNADSLIYELILTAFIETEIY
jgi:hypothetical protein